jgi:hypothetical protein
MPPVVFLVRPEKEAICGPVQRLYGLGWPATYCFSDLDNYRCGLLSMRFRDRGKILTGMALQRNKPDTQLVELAGRSWLASQLMRSGIEVARPERDRGIDLIAYVDRDTRIRNFIACPIQMKAATGAVFSLDPKYAKFPGLVLAYVWNLGNPSSTTCFALTYREALGIARKMGWTKQPTWLTGGKSGKRRYSTTNPSKRLRSLLAAYKMDADKWWRKVSISEQSQRNAR